PFSVGLNCSAGASAMRPHLATLVRLADCHVSCYPSAGLPDTSGRHPDDPERFAGAMRELARAGLVDIAGGCCGTTPAHTCALVQPLQDVPPRRLASER